MKKEYRFNFKLNADDRETLLALATYLDRSQSDAIRWAIRYVSRELARGGRRSARAGALPDVIGDRREPALRDYLWREESRREESRHEESRHGFGPAGEPFEEPF